LLQQIETDRRSRREALRLETREAVRAMGLDPGKIKHQPFE
jgi:hypothetical protein